MKVTAEIDVTPAQYFNHLCDGVIKDVKKHTNRDITVKSLLDGYRYERTLNYKKRKIVIKFTVGPLIQDKYFQVKYETEETSCLYYYDFKTEQGKYYVTYGEETGYKQETIGNALGNLKRKFTQGVWKNKVFNNIELTTTYIKNHEK